MLGNQNIHFHAIGCCLHLKKLNACKLYILSVCLFTAIEPNMLVTRHGVKLIVGRSYNTHLRETLKIETKQKGLSI